MDHHFHGRSNTAVEQWPASAGLPTVSDSERNLAMTLEFKTGEHRLPDGVPVVWVAGELDLATRDQVEPRLTALATSEAALILDLRQCTFIDSSALALLVQLHQELSRRDGGAPALALVVGNPEVGRILELAGLDRVLPVVSHPDEAVAAVKQASRSGG
jgi:anti-sigma B factor antagonist